MTSSTASRSLRVALLGTGIMGAAMARNLLKAGHQVTVWNRTPERAQALAADGARFAADPACTALPGVRRRFARAGAYARRRRSRLA